MRRADYTVALAPLSTVSLSLLTLALYRLDRTATLFEIRIRCSEKDQTVWLWHSLCARLAHYKPKNPYPRLMTKSPYL